MLADEFGKRGIIVDASNEIGDDGDILHPAIGSVRRMQVPHPERQHAAGVGSEPQRHLVIYPA